MAILVPSLEEINSLPQELQPGERRLMEALLEALDDNWTVYVQPHLNGLKPDVVIFSEDAGLGIFEVKDWGLDSYRIENRVWQVYDSNKQQWVSKAEDCPLKQVKKYKESIFKYEIPVLGARQIVDRSIYSLIQPFIYFDKHTTDDIKKRLQTILDQHSNVFGRDELSPVRLRSMLAKRHLRHGSKFAKWMKENELDGRLRNALAYPQHGDTGVKSLLQVPTTKQKNLLPNIPGLRRVLGAAGSGKTFVLVHKAVNAARDGKKVLLVCFNITMVNYLRDLVTRLARHYGFHYHRNIEVGHFHRFFPYIDQNPNIDRRSMKGSIDVLLIDEGQDFERFWIERLQALGTSDYHLMFCEDGRQNIYGKSIKDRGAIPGIKGRPYELNESLRLSPQTVKLANAFSDWAKQESLAEAVKSIKVTQGNLFARNIWFDGTVDDAINAIRDDVKKITCDKNTARADIAILLCTVEDGWKICELLEELSFPCQRNFESREENQVLRDRHKNDEDFREELDEIRRRYKAGFWMQGGKIKVCTIHSFKGWELSNILIFFNPREAQSKEKIALLYTAITRSQQFLTIYNSDPSFSPFGKLATAEGYVESHTKQTSLVYQGNANYDGIPF